MSPSRWRINDLILAPTRSSGGTKATRPWTRNSITYTLKIPIWEQLRVSLDLVGRSGSEAARNAKIEGRLELKTRQCWIHVCAWRFIDYHATRARCVQGIPGHWRPGGPSQCCGHLCSARTTTERKSTSASFRRATAATAADITNRRGRTAAPLRLQLELQTTAAPNGMKRHQSGDKPAGFSASSGAPPPTAPVGGTFQGVQRQHDSGVAMGQATTLPRRPDAPRRSLCSVRVRQADDTVLLL